MYIIPTVLIVAILVTLMFSRPFKSRGPFGGLLLFFMVIFLTTWSVQLWITPVRPLFLGIDWILLLFTVIIFSTLMMVVSNPEERAEEEGPVEEKEDDSLQGLTVAMRLFFWILILALVIAIVAGYYKTPSPVRNSSDNGFVVSDFRKTLLFSFISFY